jgi:hypothetical protein
VPPHAGSGAKFAARAILNGCDRKENRAEAETESFVNAFFTMNLNEFSPPLDRQAVLDVRKMGPEKYFRPLIFPAARHFSM